MRSSKRLAWKSERRAEVPDDHVGLAPAGRERDAAVGIVDDVALLQICGGATLIIARAEIEIAASEASPEGNGDARAGDPCVRSVVLVGGREPMGISVGPLERGMGREIGVGDRAVHIWAKRTVGNLELTSDSAPADEIVRHNLEADAAGDRVERNSFCLPAVLHHSAVDAQLNVAAPIKAKESEDVTAPSCSDVIGKVSLRLGHHTVRAERESGWNQWPAKHDALLCGRAVGVAGKQEEREQR